MVLMRSRSEPRDAQSQSDPAMIDHFERHGIMENTRIVSRCKHCGATLVGSPADGLDEKEREHVKWCAMQRLEH